MTNLPDTLSRGEVADIRERYLTISQDSRYGHFVRIPQRICRCLDYFSLAASRVAIRERMHSYYLFIGVVDELIDSTRIEAGREILGRFDNRIPCFDQETMQSPARLAAEVLKCHIGADIYATALAKLKQLYRAVVRERNSTTISAYIEERKVVGRLTAELSYFLMRPLFEADRGDLCRFLEDVGEVGCLIDSVIDLRTDDRLGLLSFSPTLKDHLKLATITLREGIRVTLKHPRLFGLFLEAVGDNVLDQLRSISSARKRPGVMPILETHSDTSRATAEGLASVAWTKT